MQVQINQRVRELFDEVVRLPRDARQGWLSSLNGEERTTIAEVQSLLESLDDAGDFLGEPHADETSFREPPGAHVGPFVIRRHIGAGGFGDVYLAEQGEPVRRRVALKIIKPGMDSREVLARFRAERHTLAMLEHPGIARIIDGGATPAGRPYYVMELVDGARVTRWCDEHRLSIARRVELFLHVCDAVQHAHQRGVIHRDLKPANVLVAEIDGKPVPKVIDFGVAKVLRGEDGAADANSMLTVQPRALGTPAYMSPEQLRGATVDTRTDVYSLGVLLYELLCGRLPFDSSVPRDPGAEAPPLTRSVPRPNVTLTRALAGELEWIVGRCLRADRDERYATVNALSEDLRAYLAGQPVTAAPPSRAYRARKFLARHKAGVAASAAMLLLLIAGIITTSWLAVRAARAERLAQSRLVDARAANADLNAVNEFLTNDMIGSADPAVMQGRELTVRQALDGAAAALDRRFPDSPLIEASVRSSVASAYLKLGRADLALPHVHAALERRRRLQGEEHPATITALDNYAEVLRTLGRYGEAEPLARQALERSRRVKGTDHPDTISALHNYAVVLSALGGGAEAEPLQKQAWEQFRAVLGVEHRETIAALNTYADLVLERGRPADAEPLFKEALERTRQSLGDNHPGTLTSMQHYARALEATGRLAEAEAIFTDVLARRRRVLGDDHAATLATLGGYAQMLHAEGRAAEAEPLFKESLERYRRLHGDEHPETIARLSDYAGVLVTLGRPAEAEPLFSDALDRARRVRGEDHPVTLAILANYAVVLNALERHTEAEPLLREAWERNRRVKGELHTDAIAALHNYATVLKNLGRHADAEPMFAELYRTAARAQIPPALAAQFMSKYGVCLARLGRHEQAEPPLREAYRRLRETNQVNHARMREVVAALAEVCDRTNRPAEASAFRAELGASDPASGPASPPASP